MTLQRCFRKQRMVECRWSVLGYRPKPMSDNDDELECFWTCERAATSVPVTPADCARCPHWTPETGSRGSGRRRLRD